MKKLLVTFLVELGIIGGTAVISPTFLQDHAIYFVVASVLGLLLVGLSDHVTIKWGKDETAQERIDRLKLADEAQRLSAGIAKLLAEHAAAHVKAWEDDAKAMIANSNGLHRDNTTSLRARLMERFGDLYAPQVWDVLHRAGKCIPLDSSALWHLSHGISDYQLHGLQQLLSKIAVDLRYPHDADVPQFDRYRQPPIQAEASAPQLPPDTGTEKPQ